MENVGILIENKKISIENERTLIESERILIENERILIQNYFRSELERPGTRPAEGKWKNFN